MGRFIFISSVGIWLGTVISFTHLVVPLVRATLHPEAAFDLLQKLFPRCCTLGLLYGLTALATVSLAAQNPGWPASRRVLLAFPITLSILCTLVAQFYIQPRMADWYNHDLPYRDRMLRISALLNNSVIFMLVFALATFATH